jgi:hypothetical protein
MACVGKDNKALPTLAWKSKRAIIPAHEFDYRRCMVGRDTFNSCLPLGHLQVPASLRNRPTKAAILFDPNPQQPFPCELKPGAVWRGLTEQTSELEEWAEK